MRLPTPLSLLPLLLLTTSAVPSHTAHRLLLPRRHLLRKQNSNCPIAYPVPRASPPDTEPPYPIQITITSASSNSQDDDGQDSDNDTQYSRDADANTTTTNTQRARFPPPPNPQPQHQQRDPPPPPPPLELCFSPPPTPSTSTTSASAPTGGPCTLALNLSSPDARVSGAATVDVRALDGPDADADAGALVGTARFAAGEVATVNSFGCGEGEVCFRFEVVGGGGDDGDDGEVGYLQGGPGAEGMGLSLRFGC